MWRVCGKASVLARSRFAREKSSGRGDQRLVASCWLLTQPAHRARSFTSTLRNILLKATTCAPPPLYPRISLALTNQDIIRSYYLRASNCEILIDRRQVPHVACILAFGIRSDSMVAISSRRERVRLPPPLHGFASLVHITPACGIPATNGISSSQDSEGRRSTIIARCP
jgi:hypothetical protein